MSFILGTIKKELSKELSITSLGGNFNFELVICKSVNYLKLTDCFSPTELETTMTTF